MCYGQAAESSRTRRIVVPHSSVPWLWFTVPRKRLVKRHLIGQGPCYGLLTLFTIVPSVLNEYVTYTWANRRCSCSVFPGPRSRLPNIPVPKPRSRNRGQITSVT